MTHAKSLLDRETDARFWAQTHYRIGQRLDPHNRADREMIPVWLDILSKVRQEDRAGRLVVTYNHPVVERGIEDAATAGTAAEAHLDAAGQAPDEASARAHADAAARSAQIAADAARAASARQPPTASPAVADRAAAGAAASAALPPPPPIADTLPPDHPANFSPDAAPSPHPDTADHPLAAAPPPEGHPDLAAPPGETPAHLPGIAPGDHLATAQALTAPAVAARVHGDALDRARRGAPPASGSIPPRALGSLRELARRLAADSPATFVGVLGASDGRWSAPTFRSPSEIRAWYDHLSGSPDTFRYLAIFDRSDASFPGPALEVLGSSRAFGAAATNGSAGPRSSPSPPGPAGGGITPGRVAVVGGVIVAGTLAMFAAASHRHRRMP